MSVKILNIDSHLKVKFNDTENLLILNRPMKINATFTLQMREHIIMNDINTEKSTDTPEITSTLRNLFDEINDAQALLSQGELAKASLHLEIIKDYFLQIMNEESSVPMEIDFFIKIH